MFLYALFWVIPRRLNFIFQRFGTLCLFHLHRRIGIHTYTPMKMEHSVPKRRHIKFRCRGITKKKAYNIQNTAKVWNQENVHVFGTGITLPGRAELNQASPEPCRPQVYAVFLAQISSYLIGAIHFSHVSYNLVYTGHCCPTQSPVNFDYVRGEQPFEHQGQTMRRHVCGTHYKYKDVSKSSRTVLVKRRLLTLDVKFLHHLQSTPLLHEYSGPSVSAMLGRIPGSPFLELCQVPAAIPLESLQWCRIFDPSSEALAWGRGKSQGTRSGEYGGWGTTVMLFLVKNCENLKDLWAEALSWWIMSFWFCHFCGLLRRTFSRKLLRTSQ